MIKTEMRVFNRIIIKLIVIIYLENSKKIYF